MGGLYKKSEAGLVAVLVIVIALFFFGWLINLNQRECNRNKDCGSESYCGSDFSCHSYPTIQKTVVQYNLFWPAVIMAIAIVAAAIIFKGDKIRWRKTAVEHKVEQIPREETDETAEPYYKSNDAYYKSTTNSKTP